jgi:ribosome recycling factor
MSEDPVVAALRKRMEGSLETLRKEFAGIRTGRASPTLLDPVRVDAYGQSLPMNQVGSVSAPEPRLIVVQVWDKGLVKSVEKAIREANMNLNPQADGQLIRVPIPDLSEDRRKEMTKITAKYAEQARVAVRNVRREGMDALKKQEKDGKLPQDAHRKLDKEVQALTDAMVKKVDEMLHQKDKEILQV